MSELMIYEVFEYLGWKEWENQTKADEFLCWPPDVFAVVTFILRESGAYARIIGEPHQHGFLDCRKRQEEARAVADQWMESAIAIRKAASATTVVPPPYVREAWAAIRAQARVMPLSKIVGHTLAATSATGELPLWAHLLKLMAAADIACAGCGLRPSTRVRDTNGDPVLVKRFALIEELQMIVFIMLVDQALLEVPVPSTLCLLIDVSRVAVLPKMHTAQVGLTVRCFSHNLALSYRSDVQARWRFAGNEEQPRLRHGRNLLLVPWPHSIRPSQFAESVCRDGMRDQLPDGHAYFQFNKDKSDEIKLEYVQSLLTAARKEVGPIDGIVFPEAAMNEDELEMLKPLMADGKLDFIATGVYKPPTDHHPGENYAKIVYHTDDEVVEVEQHKHHRWSLDRSQIVNYGLGGSLDPSHRWWECIKIHKRDVHFIALDPLLVFTVLICEDLARPEPVGDLVRSVGPNLVIALLQDGPQLESRWSSRYAMSLTDDPGCSVLTLTSLGMSRMSRPRGATGDHSRVVALWRDRTTGTRQLSLPRNAEALVLCLNETREEEWTADGRGDGKNAGGLHLVGVSYVRTPDKTSTAVE